MSCHDAERDLFKTSVSCAALLEHLPPPWRLDRPGSTRRALKYRRDAGEILIINHDGRGWWDPRSTAKGDVFDLVQHLDPALNFGQVRQVLRRFVGVTPTFPETARERRQDPDRPIAERWRRRSRLRPGSPAWTYLSAERCLPACVLALAAEADAVREGFYGSAWFAHRRDGAVSHIEVRGPAFKGALRGGAKTLFRFGRAQGGQGASRLAIAEAPIDALSLAAIEDVRADTLYVATGGGTGPGTVAALETEMRAVAAVSAPAAVIISATDADAAGERYAARHAALAAAAGFRFGRLAPTVGTDWNETLKHRRGP